MQSETLSQGKSLNPSAVNLQAIADALECSVKDLLTLPHALQLKDPLLSLEEHLQETHVTSSLMGDCAHVVEKLLQTNKKVITTHQYLTFMRELYLYSLQKSSPTVNKDFAEWFIDLIKSGDSQK